MKRLVISLIILIFIFLVAFALSILLFPSWLSQPEWQAILSKNIVVTGSLAIGSGVISWILSFLFEDKEFKERVNFLVGNKYKNISTKIDVFTRSELSKEKLSRRYIPDIFIETTELKEKLRYFSEPFLFFPKIAERIYRQIGGDYIFVLLKNIHYPLKTYKSINFWKKIPNEVVLKKKINSLKKYIDQQKENINVLIKGNGVGIKPEYLSNIPSEYSHIYGYVYPNLQFTYSLDSSFDQADEDLHLLINKILLLKGLAGHGKTNLLCDFTENFLLRKNHKCLYLPARELNYIGGQETIEQSISRILFSESNYQFLDILRLIKFDKQISFFFILIDGINEHKDLNLFSTALEQFIQRCNEYKLKFILTCRSEYFDDRFGNLLHFENCSIIDMDSREYVHKIPDVHQNALISRYFSEFNIQLQLDRIHPEIIDIFNEDKLLLRIFSEAYENDQPADYLDDLYKLEIFNRYHEKKLEVVPGLDSCLSEIISWMIEHEEFGNIRIINISPQSSEIIERIVYESIVIRKDIIVTPGVAFGKSEVINFVYDEFRDFLLASNIIVSWNKNNILAREQIKKFTKTRSTISEGLQKYLCLWGVKNEQQDLITFLSSFSWFNLIFTLAVINSPDKYHSAFIISQMRHLFYSDSKCALHIIFYLIHRANVDQHKNLNFDLLLEWLNQVDELVYQNIISTALNMEKDYNLSYINYLCHNILMAFQEKKVSEQLTPKLIQLLCYFSGIRDLKYPKYRENGFGQFPAYDVILMIKQKNFSNLVHEQVRLIHRICMVEPIRENLKGILHELGER